MFNALFLFITIQVVSSTNEVTQEDLSKLATANNDLAGRIYPRLIKDYKGNVFFFPLSLTTGLGIMLDGAKGKTQDELYSVLGYKSAGLAFEKIKPTYYYYLNEELPQNKRHFPYYDLFCADEVLVTNKAKLNETFRKEEEQDYTTRIQNVDFSHHEQVSKKINEYVKSHTDGHINHIVKDVSSKSSAVLIDAAFFKGRWETPFPRFWTFLEKFTSTKEENVPFMLAIHQFPYYENKEFKAVFLPYIGGFLGLLILEPQDVDGLSKMEETMTPDKIIAVVNQLQNERTLVLLPRLKVEYERDYKKDFEELGAKTPFEKGADFSGMTSSKDLMVTNVLHKAFLEVDRADEGTGLAVDFSQPISKFIFASHPFMFAVVDIRHNLILAMGRVTHV